MRKVTSSSDPLNFVVQEFVKTLTSDFKSLTLVLHNPRTATNYYLEFDTALSKPTAFQRRQLALIKLSIWNIRNQITTLHFTTSDNRYCTYSTLEDFTFNDFSDYIKLNK